MCFINTKISRALEQKMLHKKSTSIIRYSGNTPNTLISIIKFGIKTKNLDMVDSDEEVEA